MTKTTVKNSIELYDLFTKKYQDRFEGDPLIAMTGRIEGTIDSKKIVISFGENKYLLISTEPTSKNILDELQPFLTEIMGNQKPICSYDMQTENTTEDSALPTIEWDIENPEQRLKDIVNGRAFSTKTKINNLKLYNNKNLEDYLESEKEKNERIKNARIYGIDPGCIKDVEEINNLNEIDLYFMIDAIGGHIWRCRHDMAHGRIPEVDLTEETYALEYLVYQTTKFGVKLDEPTIDQHITATPSYRAWYEFYNNHFKHVLTDKQWNDYQNAKKSGQDTSEFMPIGNWADLLEKDPQKNKETN